MSAQLQPLEAPRLTERTEPAPSSETMIELSAFAEPKSPMTPQVSVDEPPAASLSLPPGPPATGRSSSVVARLASVRFFDILFHDHSLTNHEHHKADEDLPGYRDPSVAPILAAVKGGLSKAAPFAFLNYLLLLTILYDTHHLFCDACTDVFVEAL
jgi:hypothetical protein